MESDPIGLNGGLNTFTYALLNPFKNSDPSGLITWKGQMQAGGAVAPVGTFGAVFTLESECVNGNKVQVTVVAVGPALGLGVTVSGTRGSVEFTDNESSVNPSVFNGEFRMVGAGVAVGPEPPKILPPGAFGGGGYGAAAIQLGGATSFGHGLAYGFDASIVGVGGSSTVTQVSYVQCGCE